ncbi:DUF1317 family protein [Mixta gaviniae]|uniref:Cruciferin n=1 Tax=Mixta gaviniae TaxID=665914 RepID=A0A2L0IGI9_9GAMM|nr:DUF1317 family protein [Mixta gaviniae]AUX93675.1 cruciferin [Mixta gaviniae]
MQKPNDHITVGIITLPYSFILGGWVTPKGNVVTNLLTAQRIAEDLNSKVTIH